MEVPVSGCAKGFGAEAPRIQGHGPPAEHQLVKRNAHVCVAQCCVLRGSLRHVESLAAAIVCDSEEAQKGRRDLQALKSSNRAEMEGVPFRKVEAPEVHQ
jgi:hypothetical protein